MKLECGSVGALRALRTSLCASYRATKASAHPHGATPETSSARSTGYDARFMNRYSLMLFS